MHAFTDSPWDRLHEVIIIGAGPAGAAAAHDLAAGGARVLVVERERLPRYKTCGGAVAARALTLLPADLDLAPERSCHSVWLDFAGGPGPFEVHRGSPVMAMTMRADFDAALLRWACGAGAEVVEGCSFEGVEERAGVLHVTTSRGALRSRFLVGADGVASHVARSAGWRQRPLAVPALEAEITVSSAVLERFATHARFHLGTPAGGYGWIFPKRGHLSAGVLRMRRGGAPLETLLHRYLDAAGVTGIQDMELHGFPIPVRPRPGGAARGRVLLVGDAAGLADPVTAEGISYALRSGQLAARAVLAGADQAGAAARSYQRALGAEILGELRLARGLARLVYGAPRVRRALFHRFGQPFSEAMTDIICGTMTYRRALTRPAHYGRLLRRMLSG